MKIKLFLIGLFLVLFQKTVLAADYYWVGGSGLWSEVNGHWATTSGGNTFHAIVPTSQDNVIFDENSFTAAGQTVTLDGSFANCANMDWSAVTYEPEFISPETSTLYIFGSLDLATDMTVSLEGNVEFQSNTTGETILSAGHQLTENNVFFAGVGGEWTLLDSMTVGHEIRLQSGKINTDGYSVNTVDFYISDDTEIDISNSNIYLNGYWSVGNTNVSLSTANSVIHNRSSYGSINGGDGQQYNSLILEGSSNVSGENLYIESIEYRDGGTLSTEFSEVNTMVVDGTSFRFSGGDNLIHSATINATNSVIFSEVPSYRDYTANHEFGDLNFTSAGVVITLPPSSVQTVTSSLLVSGSCTGFSTIRSLDANEPVEFNVSSNVDIEFVNLAGIHISGGATYTADNSVDMGGNDGWIINEPTSQTLYWIGGEGNWSDGQNWSLTSGGAPYGCPPTAKDNVVFDANSFDAPDQVVQVTAAANCNNMDWSAASNNPIFDANEQLTVFGSLTYAENMEVEVSRDIYFSSCAAGNTIDTKGHQLTRRNIYFNCKSGEWSLLDSLVIGSDMFLNAGSFKGNGHYMEADEIVIEDTTSINIENSKVSLEFDGWDIGNAVQLKAEGSEIHLNRDTWGRLRAGANYTYGDVYLNTGSTHISNSNGSTFNNVYVKGKEGNSIDIDKGSIKYLESESDELFFGGDSAYVESAVINNAKSFNISRNYNGSPITFGDLEVTTPGITVTIANEHLVVENQLIINGNCSSYTVLKSSTAGTPINIETSNDVDLSYVSITDVAIGTGATYTASESIDNGGNSGWDFTAPPSRTLYWIGGEGDWADGQNWSLTSGGAPLGCAPSPLDTAVFDDNSFSSTGQTVSVTGPTSVGTIDWTDVTQEPIFEGEAEMNIYGSLWYSPDMEVEYEGTIYFQSCASGNTILSEGQEITDYRVYFNCNDGEWTLLDTLKTQYIYHNAGNLITDGKTVDAYSFYVRDDTELDIRNSEINLGYRWDMGDDVVFQAENSHISVRDDFDGGRDYDYWDVTLSGVGSSSFNDELNGYELTFNTVVLENEYLSFEPRDSEVQQLILNGSVNEIGGSGNVIRSAEINSPNRATVLGEHEFDTLRLNTAGQRFVLQSGETQLINHEFDISQTVSFPIYISSTTQGTQGHINFLGNIPPCSEYVFLRDSDIYGPSGMEFYAGLDSDDIDNNTGWIFETNANCQTLLCEFEGIDLDLGPDTTFCEEFTIDAGTYGVEVQYQWEALSRGMNAKDTLQYFDVNLTDSVVVTVYTEICNISDTIVVREQPCSASQYNLCGDADSLKLLPSKPNLIYEWSTGETTDSIVVKDAGVYWVDITEAGLDTRDTFVVTKTNLPKVDLGNDTVLCNGQVYAYSAPSEYDSYSWSFGGTTADYSTDTSAFVWVEAYRDNCVVKDTVLIQADSIDFTGFGRTDTTLCSLNDTISYSLVLDNLSYVWENGDTGFETGEKEITQPGVYWVEVFSDLGCKVRDSIMVNLSDIEPIDLGNDTLLCNDGELSLSIGNDYDNTLWSDGEQDHEMTIEFMGKYWVSALKGSCMVSDTIIVNKVEVSFGGGLGKDTTLCSGDSLYWNETLPSGLSYEWEDGTSGTTQMERTIKDAGTYWLEIDSYGCTARDSIEINVVNTSAISLGEDTVLCDGASLNLSVASVYDTYEWSTGANGNSISINSADEYWLTVTQANCEATDTIIVNTVSSPDFSLGNDTTICPGNDVVFEEDSALVNFTWDNGLTGLGFVNRTVSDSGVYWLELDYMGCTSRDTILVSVVEFNQSGLSSDTILCPGAVMNLSVKTGFDSYEWSTGDVTNTADVSTEGIYWVDLTQSNCVFRDSITVMDFTLPNIFEHKDTTFCPDNYLIIEETFSGLNYKWENGSSGFEEVYREINQPGLYWLELSSGACAVRDTLLVEQEEVPDFSIGNDTSICSVETLLLTLPSGFINPVWDNGSTSDNHLVDESGLYTVNAKWKNCSVYDDVYITLVDDLCPEDPLVFPTAFTPNGDGVNDTWVIDGLEKYPNSRVQIFNRWGHMIFESNNYHNQWDGEDLPMGTYYYALWHEESVKEITGTVTIIRME